MITSRDAVFWMKREKMTKKILSRKFLSALVAVVLVAVIAAPVLASTATATRSLPASVASGAKFDVTVQPSGCGAFGQVVETLPAGFTYISCTPSDVGVEQVGHTIKFTFLGDSVSFTYRVKAPTIDTTTTYTFHGIVKDENKNEYPIEDSDITVTVDAPPPETYTLTMAVDGNGSAIPPVGSHIYEAGTVVNISATPASGWQFDSWSGDVTDPSSSSTTVTMDSNKTITAYFTPIPSITYTLTLTCQPSDGGTVTLSPTGEGNQYAEGTSVELTAIPTESYVFSCWSGDLSGSNNLITIIMDSNKSVTANFVLSVSDEASFTVSPLNISPEQVQSNQQVNISVKITNNGEQAGSYQAVLYINGQVEDSQTVSISPGSSRNVVFNITKATPGAYTVLLGGQQGQFTVVGSQSTSGGLNIGTTIAIVLIAVLIAALVLVFRRIKKRA